MLRLRSVLSNRALLALMSGHFVNDMLVNVLPQLYPIAKSKFQINNADVGFITLAYTIGSSFLQPFFGHLSDKLQNRWLAPAILAWSTIWMSAVGLSTSYWMLFGLAALAGIGSGAYHPLGASSASRITDPRVRNTALSIYTVAGSVGYAIGPLLAVAALGWLGASGTTLFLIPGGLGVILLVSQMGNVMRHSAQRAAIDTVVEQRAIPYASLAKVVGVVMLRSWSFLALIQFIPVWYDDIGYGREVYGSLTTTMIAAGAFGTLVGGALSDRIGGRSVIVVSQILCIPAILLFVQFPGPAAFVLGAVFGLLSDASLSVTLSAAQRLLPGRTGIASGVILGLGFITGGVGVPITGYIADRASIDVALSLLAILCFGAALLAWSTDRRLYEQPDDALPRGRRAGMMFGRVEAIAERTDAPDRIRISVYLETGARMQTVRDELVLVFGEVESIDGLAWHADQYAQETIANELAMEGWEPIGGGEIPAPEPGAIARSATYAVRRLFYPEPA